MRDRDPLRAVGSVFVRRGDASTFAGTCFAFRHADRVLTAGHCVQGLEPDDVEVVFMGAARRFRAIGVVRHPTADLALLRLARDAPPPAAEPFAVRGRSERGQAFAGFGSVAGVCERFEGRVRRVFVDEHDGHRHAEMSIAARDGFSGGPLFSPAAPFAVVGLMTENRTTPLALARSRLVRRLRPGARSGQATGRGIALLLDDLSDWLDEHVPEDTRKP
jgi:hypothetical protein